MNKTLKLSILLLICALFLASCVKEQEQAHTLIDPVVQARGTVTVERGDYTSVTVKDAFVVPEVVSILSPMTGKIADLYYVSGDYVKKGDPVLRFDTYREEEEKAAIQADMEYNDSLYEVDDRIYTLKKQYLETEISTSYQQGAGWQTVELLKCDLQELELDREKVLDDREKKREEQEKRLEELEKIIGDASIYAPVSGRIYYAGTADDGKKTVEEGKSVSDGDELIFITDESRLHIEMEERMLQTLQQYPYYALVRGQAVQVEYVPRTASEAASDRLLKRLPKTVFKLKGSTAGLESGMYTPIIFETAVFSDALLVPAAAVIRDPDLGRDFVYVLDESGERTRRDVEILSDGVKAVILSGLSEGEVLYVYE